MREYTLEVNETELSYLILLLDRMRELHGNQGGYVAADDICVCPSLTTPLSEKLWELKQAEVARRTIEREFSEFCSAFT
jgi:hypothetical protein